MAIETPKYAVLQKDGKFEIRKYDGYINASVEVESDYNHALGEGFNILADYIFGNNRAKTTIEMTAPVTEQTVKGKKIEMTALVTAKKVGEGRRHLVSFTIPAKYTLDSLPQPVNTAISINQVGPYKAAVLKFSGYMNEKTTAKKIQELQVWLKTNKFDAKSGFITAQYNPPWIPGPFRRNEIIAEI